MQLVTGPSRSNISRLNVSTRFKHDILVQEQNIVVINIKFKLGCDQFGSTATLYKTAQMSKVTVSLTEDRRRHIGDTSCSHIHLVLSKSLFPIPFLTALINGQLRLVNGNGPIAIEYHIKLREIHNFLTSLLGRNLFQYSARNEINWLVKVRGKLLNG